MPRYKIVPFCSRPCVRTSAEATLASHPEMHFQIAIYGDDWGIWVNAFAQYILQRERW